MKVFNRQRVRYDSGPNLTSLVDVVMVVLIFLMLAGSFAGTRVIPGARVASARALAGPEPLAIEVRVQEDPQTHGTILTAGDLQVRNDVQKLLVGLRAKQAAYVASGINPSNVQVVVRPSGNVSYQNVLSVYETVQRAGFHRVAFAGSR